MTETGYSRQWVSEENSLDLCVRSATRLLLSHQSPEGYWWYTLEANETIGAGFIQLMHFLDEVDPDTQSGLVRRILSQQDQTEGSWPIFFGGPGDLSTTIECYFALRLSGLSPAEPALERAKAFILGQGGLTKMRVFSRIHLALFGLVPWSSCPSMPVWFALLPVWCGISIYEFSSWARASVVPLLLLDSVRPVKSLPFSVDELFVESKDKRQFHFPKPDRIFSMQNFFILFDCLLKILERFPWRLLGNFAKKRAVSVAEKWVREHIERTEDIYPAMAYAILGLKALGYPNQDPTIQKALHGLKQFQHPYARDLPPNRGEAGRDPALPGAAVGRGAKPPSESIHQQCCISPVWDTPWVGLALLEAGLDPQDPRLLKAARYLLSKEIRNFRGDWKMKNPSGPAGGWSFEFQNEYFPDVDDTLVILNFLRKVGLSQDLSWLLSMQSQNGGWAAFDKDNTSAWVNKIPFSDHGACLDPPTPDITGRVVELLMGSGFLKENPVIVKALRFLKETQEECGAWRGRWGVNFIHGTWSVFQGLSAVGEDFRAPALCKAIDWLRSIQNSDGGWGESCLSDRENRYVPLGVSTASQTAWAVMALTAAGEVKSQAVSSGVQWLVANQNAAGGWDEPYFTGTGFPGYFYVRYHGYRHYFPLLALGRFLSEAG